MDILITVKAHRSKIMLILARLFEWVAPETFNSLMGKLCGSKLGPGLSFWFVCIAGGSGMFPQSASAVSYIQGDYAAWQSPQRIVQVPYLWAQAAGDLNVVIVGWNSAAGAISSVSDGNGNIYHLAIGPTRLSGALSQSIYYASNIGRRSRGQKCSDGAILTSRDLPGHSNFRVQWD